VRVCESADGALPSANSVAADVLLRLGRLTGREGYEGAAHRTLEALGGRVTASPAAHTAFLQATQFALGPAAEVVIAGDPGTPATAPFLAPLQRSFRPRIVTLVRPKTGSGAEHLARVAPFTEAFAQAGDAGATAYLCRDHACERPRTDPAEFEAALEAV
jgi:uncharacterized protein YyaL (SSP411 family)